MVAAAVVLAAAAAVDADSYVHTHLRLYSLVDAPRSENFSHKCLHMYTCRSRTYHLNMLHMPAQQRSSSVLDLDEEPEGMSASEYEIQKQVPLQ